MPNIYSRKMTLVIQVTNRHIGIIHKCAVYVATKKYITRRINLGREANSTAINHDVALEYADLIPMEKIVLITEVVGDVTGRLNHSVNYFCAFIETSAWIPTSHTIPEDYGTQPAVQNSEMDINVKLHH